MPKDRLTIAAYTMSGDAVAIPRRRRANEILERKSVMMSSRAFCLRRNNSQYGGEV